MWHDWLFNSIGNSSKQSEGVIFPGLADYNTLFLTDKTHDEEPPKELFTRVFMFSW
jgi:hypothetical protein